MYDLRRIASECLAGNTKIRSTRDALNTNAAASDLPLRDLALLATLSGSLERFHQLSQSFSSTTAKEFHRLDIPQICVWGQPHVG